MQNPEPGPEPTLGTMAPFAFASSDPDEALGLLLTGRDCPPAFSGATAHRFELNSQGDRVSGRLLIPEARSGPCPLVLIQADAGASCDGASLDFAGGWVGGGFALATIDLPLHGERSSPKFSERLLEAIEIVRGGRGPDAQLDANGKSLLLEFTRQSVCDLSRTLDGLVSLPAIDDQRLGVMGLGHGAAIAAIFAGLDPRVRAVALAHCSKVSLGEINPVRFVGKIGPRPTLVLESLQTGEAAGESDSTLFDACAEPRIKRPADCENGMLASAAAETARSFFAEHLTSS